MPILKKMSVPQNRISRFTPAARNTKRLAAMPFLFLFLGCVHLVANFDPVTYKSLTDLRAETVLFLESVDGTKPYTQYSQKFDDLQLSIEKVFQYEKGKSQNTDTVSQIQEIREMINGLMKIYKEKNKLSAIFLEEKKGQLETAFDLAISTENSKTK